MPVVGARTFTIRVQDRNKGTGIDILSELRERGCISLRELSDRTGTPVDEVRREARMLAGDAVCDSEVCCLNREIYSRFVNKMRKLRDRT